MRNTGSQYTLSVTNRVIFAVKISGMITYMKYRSINSWELITSIT
jgi:hypothetical protein